ncbi:LLM class F420-dependent oxidoreductase [Streptomyces sp. NPDC002574]|uniref:LLM class F420-dependent oxidoreductase n=1 Tax=Streptomyces sp. NPDC002574 TaxID=3364652 RepID=UPI00369E8202
MNGLKEALGPIGIFTHELRSEDPSQQDLIRLAAAEVEDLGFGAIWLGGSSSVRHAAHLAASTDRVVLATGILNIWFEDADSVAAHRADLERSHPGRFLLGLGASHAALARDYRRPYSTMVEYLDHLDAAVPTVPADRRVLAALGPKMLGLSRDRAAGAHPYLVTPEYLEQARGILGPEPLLAPEVTVVLDDDPTTARATARGFLRYYLELPNYAANLKRLGFTDDDLADAGSDRLVDALVVWGPDETVRHRLHRFLAAGADHLALQVVTGNGDSAPPLAQWRRLAELTAALTQGATMGS